MKWLTLYNKLGKQPVKNTRLHDVEILMPDGQTKHKLVLKFKVDGTPYFVVDNR